MFHNLKSDSYLLVFRVLAISLLLAALLKSYQLSTESLPNKGFLTSRASLVILVESEIALGLWLWFGFYPKTTCWVALIWFCTMLSASLIMTVSGERSCGCFGKLPVLPWIVSLFDGISVVLLGLLSFSMREIYPKVTFSKLFWMLVLFLGISIPCCYGVTQGPDSFELLEVSPKQIELGEISNSRPMYSAFSLKNTSTDPVEISELRTSCHCLRLILPVMRLNPGEVVNGLAEIDPGVDNKSGLNLAMSATGKSQSGNLAFRIVVLASISEE